MRGSAVRQPKIHARKIFIDVASEMHIWIFEVQLFIMVDYHQDFFVSVSVCNMCFVLGDIHLVFGGCRVGDHLSFVFVGLLSLFLISACFFFMPNPITIAAAWFLQKMVAIFRFVILPSTVYTFRRVCLLWLTSNTTGQ